MIDDASYVLRTDLHPFQELDEFALLARQDYNLGNGTNWFGCFRGGLYGFYARVHGLGVHYRLLHEWIPPRLHTRTDTEYHVASTLFNMDSAVECLAFALNALGFTTQPNGFRDITKGNALSKISPKDVLGNPATRPPRQPLKGYLQIYPTLQSYWDENRDLLHRIIEFHDVSKHRETIYTGGMHRMDPPSGFFESIDVGDQDRAKVLYHPHEYILLRHEPKAPRGQRIPVAREDHVSLEELAPRFAEFLQKTGELALKDSRANIELPYSEFQQATSE